MAKKPETKKSSVIGGEQDDPANIAPATTFEASGAVIEPSVVSDVDMKHPAVDDNPRKGTSVDMNRIDFNDPTKTDQEAVEDNLKDQA